MQSTYTDGPRTFLCGEDLVAYRRVKIKGGTVTTPPEVEYADAGEAFIGITLENKKEGQEISVATLTKEGTFLVTAAEPFALNATLYGAADGKVQDTSSGTAFFKALQAATADGDVVEVILYPGVSTTAATVTFADADERTDAATVEAALAELYEALLNAEKTIPIPLAAITQEDGTPLTVLNGTTSGFTQLSNAEQVISIPINATVEALGFSTPVPQDLDDSEDITIHVLAGKSANNDALTLDCEVYPCAVGDTGNADIQDTAAQTITQAASELVFTCGADGVLAAPGTISAILTLGGTNDGDAVYIYGAWIEYTPKLIAIA